MVRLHDELGGIWADAVPALDKMRLTGRLIHDDMDEDAANADADERHLFIPLHDSALPFSISSELVFEDTLPPEPPPLPESVTHPWLAPASSRRVLLWSRAAGWRNFPTA